MCNDKTRLHQSTINNTSCISWKYRLHLISNWLRIYKIISVPKQNLPYIISLAICFPVPYEASACLVQVLVALHALQTGCVPLQVGGDPQDVLVMDLTAAAYTHRKSGLLCTWKKKYIVVSCYTGVNWAAPSNVFSLKNIEIISSNL